MDANESEKVSALCVECHEPVEVDDQKHRSHFFPLLRLCTAGPPPLCKSCELMVRVECFRLRKFPPLPWKVPAWRPSNQECIAAERRKRYVEEINDAPSGVDTVGEAARS